MKRYSILTNDMSCCFVCGSVTNVHIHEVFFGTAKRQLSIKYGCCVGLCGKHHNLSKEGVHFNRELDLQLKREMQKAFIKKYPTLDFIKVFGKSYL